MADELHANDVIVENYYKVIGSHDRSLSPSGQIASYVVAGILMAAGGVLILKIPKSHLKYLS